MKKGIIKACEWIFGVGCVIVIFLSVLSTIAFIVAFFTAAETTTTLTAFLNATAIPTIALITVILCFFGMLKMYINGEQAFTIDSGEE